MSTFVVGDIHGTFKALQEVLIKSSFNAETDKIIFLGDYADGWDDTYKVIELLLGIKNKATFCGNGDNIIFIRGNHDIFLQDYLNTFHITPLWKDNGGLTSVESYSRSGVDNFHEHRKFLKDCVNWYIDSKNRLFIHAGWDHRKDFFLGATEPASVMTIQPSMECHWDRKLLKGVKSGHFSGNGFKATEQFKEVFIGHTYTESFLPENYCNLWNLDTGAGGDGKLTIMNVDTKEYWQSELVNKLEK